MKENKFKTIEDDGIVIFDSSDDYVPGEEILDDDDEFDTEYLIRETARQEAQRTKEQRKQRWISAVVVAAVVSFIAGVVYINFKSIL